MGLVGRSWDWVRLITQHLYQYFLPQALIDQVYLARNPNFRMMIMITLVALITLPLFKLMITPLIRSMTGAPYPSPLTTSKDIGKHSSKKRMSTNSSLGKHSNSETAYSSGVNEIEATTSNQSLDGTSGYQNFG